MKKVFYLKNCSTCKRIMAGFDLSDWELREIKTQPISDEELQEMYAQSKSYESLFSKKSQQIKILNIDVKNLTENDFKTLLLQHYSFLKRSVFLTENEIFIGNSKENIDRLEKYFSK
jgi:regulatory protein spx